MGFDPQGPAAAGGAKPYAAPQAAPGGGHAVYRPAPPGEYEFDEGENQVVSGLGGSMKFVGLFYVIVGVILAIVGLFATLAVPLLGVPLILVGVGYIVTGARARSAGDSFEEIAKSEGNDISHLMMALANLRGVYVFMLVVAVLGIVQSALALTVARPAAPTVTTTGVE